MSSIFEGEAVGAMKPRSAVRVWVFGLVCVCLWPFAVGAAHAEPVDPARSASARALFEEGVAHVDHDQWALAADAFRRALALRDSQVIRYNLASALVELGKLVEASELLHTVQADAQGDPALRQEARDKLTEIKPRIARLSVHAEAVLPGLVVELDDAELSLAQLDVPLTLDPGKHVVRALLDGEGLDEQTVELSEGASAQVTLRSAPPKPAVALLPAITPAETARLAAVEPAPNADVTRQDVEPASPSRKKLWWGVAVGGVGVAAFVTLVALLVPRANHAGSTVSGDFDPPAVNVRLAQ